ncbi:hypothetical protein Salat_1492100 [Sesamum alatum]|uniref:Uncharacterized protein n=1 Tax=Sesamum alatum TaxID=300844 RepID=A0AAE2CM44_9LAMI|nr:hypothetical protein Salat_1492100 [Sesamum alatum]
MSSIGSIDASQPHACAGVFELTFGSWTWEIIMLIRCQNCTITGLAIQQGEKGPVMPSNQEVSTNGRETVNGGFGAHDAKLLIEMVFQVFPSDSDIFLSAWGRNT